MNAPLLEVRNVSLSFRGVKAVSDVSFAVAEHEICALIGPNGAGKSSLLNIVSGVYRPDSGSIVYAGQTRPYLLPRTAATLGIARTFQNLATFKAMSVLDNVLTGRSLHRRSMWLEQTFRLPGASRDETRQREHAERVLAFLRLQSYRHAPVGQLSYGLQKRVELGRALAAEPRLLLLDEPMAGMTSDEKRETTEFVQAINREFGATVLLIEHDMRVVMELAEHVVVLDYGRIVGEGSPEDVRKNPEVLRAYLGTKRERTQQVDRVA